MAGEIVSEVLEQGCVITPITILCEAKARGSVSCRVTNSRSLSNTDTMKAAQRHLDMFGPETNLI